MLITLRSCRIVRAPQGLAVFDAISEEQVTGRVVDRMVPPRGYNSAATSGLVSFEAEGAQQQLPFGLADLQVCLFVCVFLSFCSSVGFPWLFECASCLTQTQVYFLPACLPVYVLACIVSWLVPCTASFCYLSPKLLTCKALLKSVKLI